jgi:hypothetical protein
MRKRFFFLLLLALFAGAVQSTANAQPIPTFDISYSSLGGGRLTGRMFLIFAHSDSIEPRLQVGRYGTQFFGVDFADLPPEKAVHIDGKTLGYPINEMAAIPPGDYYVQAVLDRYTEFKRSDGHTLWMHMDQWEGQDWRRSPGNLYSNVQKISIGGAKTQRIPLTVDQIMPAIPERTDTKWVKHIKMKSKKLTAFWGQPIYIGATILLPKGYEADTEYPFPRHRRGAADLSTTQYNGTGERHAWTVGRATGYLERGVRPCERRRLFQAPVRQVNRRDR